MPTQADASVLRPGDRGAGNRGGARRLRDLSLGEWREIAVSAVKESVDDNVPMMASALAYSAFFAIPSALLLLLGVFTLVADESTIAHLVARLTEIAPSDAADLFGNSLRHLSQRSSTGLTLALVGLGLALWSASNAMSTVISALNVAYDREDSRGFFRSRLVAVVMAFFVGAAALLAGALLVMGPHLQAWLGSALDARRAVELAWWIGQWPILILGLLTIFAIVLFLAPNVSTPKWQFISPGAVFAVLVWLIASGLFAFYTSRFASYNKTWGSLSAVIVMLTWLWLAAVALLLGAELNAEADRSRELRPAEPPEA